MMMMKLCAYGWNYHSTIDDLAPAFTMCVKSQKKKQKA